MAATVDRSQATHVVPVRVVFRPEDDHWAVVAPEYSIVGIGDTPEAAYDRIQSAVQEYFDLCAREGKSLDEIRRPARGRWRLEIEAWWLIARIANALHRSRRPNDVPVELHDGLAPC
jgi:hypothetical protein